MPCGKLLVKLKEKRISKLLGEVRLSGWNLPKEFLTEQFWNRFFLLVGDLGSDSRILRLK